MKLSTDKSQVEIQSIDTEVGQGALLEFFAHAERVLSIWHPVSHVGAPLKRKHEHFDIFKASLKSNSESVILPVDAEIVQIKSTLGHVTRAVRRGSFIFRKKVKLFILTRSRINCFIKN